MERQPNTEYILSLSYGKDSLACLEAIRQLGYPLDRIIHAEVWATDTIPADLPPMVKFKFKADKIIKERYGLDVEHIYATRGGVSSRTKNSFTPLLTKEEVKENLMDSHTQSEHGVIVDSSPTCCSPLEKLTYEKIFYHIPKRRGGDSHQQTSPASLCRTDHSAVGNSKPKVYGFPISISRGNWCTQLKQRVFRKPHCTRGEEKYCAVSGYCG